MTRQAVNYIIKIAGRRAGLGHVHPHMLRHSCGYYLANKGVDFRTTQVSWVTATLSILRGIRAWRGDASKACGISFFVAAFNLRRNSIRWATRRARVFDLQGRRRQ